MSSMTSENRQKINKLYRSAPRNIVLTTSWLKTQGISTKLAWWHAKSGWLKRIADGAYQFAGDTLSWTSAVATLQQQLKLPIYPGAKTALQLLGKGHYLNMKQQTIQLFTLPTIKTPGWLNASSWQENFTVYHPKLFTLENEAALTAVEINGHRIKISSPEKAIIELCHLVPKSATFAETALIMEGLTRARPKVMQWLLENCQSYKAKRLTLYLATHYNHPWLAEINLQKVDLGKGKRVIAGGGHYDAQYKISVPALGNNI